MSGVMIINKRKKNWSYYRERRAGKSKAPYDYYHYKLRINLTPADYRTHKAAIIRFLIRHIGGDVLRSFKVPTAYCQAKWKKYDRFNQNGQFTLYLRAGCDSTKVANFAEELQRFLSEILRVSPGYPMQTDFALHSKRNIAMRLTRIDGEYVRSKRLIACPAHLYAYQHLVEDTAVFARFALGQPELPRRIEGDVAHRLMRFGFLAVYEGQEYYAFGESCQEVAHKLRRAFARMGALSLNDRCRLLSPRDWDVLKAVGIDGDVQSILQQGMTLNERRIFMLRAYINRRFSEGCLETGAKRDTHSVWAQLFKSCRGGVKLRVARKIVHHLSTGIELILTPVERDACLRKRDRLWTEVVRPYGLEGLVRDATVTSVTNVRTFPKLF